MKRVFGSVAIGLTWLSVTMPAEATSARDTRDCAGTACAAPAGAVAPPVITSPIEIGAPTARARRRTNLRQSRALDAFLVGGDGQVISDVAIDMARTGVTMRRRDGSYNSATNLVIRRVAITAAAAPIAIRGGSHGIVIEDARLTCTGTTDGVPAGIKIGARGAPADYDITIRRAVITGCASTGRKGYMQGDGIATERPDHDISIVDTVSTDHGDGCLDLKSSATRLDQVSVARCNYGLRLWAQGTAGTIRIGEVRKAGIQIKPSTDWSIDRVFLPADPPVEGDVIADGVGGRLAVKWCSRPLILRRPSAGLMLGPTCRN